VGGELEMSTRRNISSTIDQTCDIFHVLVTFKISLLQESPALQCTEGSPFFLLINRFCGENCHIQWHMLKHFLRCQWGCLTQTSHEMSVQL
jgi:hypothetical protein